MASRLHTDDTKGQSKWADIDEDDEDWEAPDAFTWSDGTKTTIPHVDDTPTIVEQPVLEPPQTVEQPPQMPVPRANPVSSSPAAKPSLPSGKGLVLKGGASSEKPTLVAKPPAPPTPVKSPWASLPPVSKVSPMEGPPEQPRGAFGSPGQTYARGPPPPAAREIAADDFSRSPRRDNQQLFNSQSGRYEPVPDRRGIARADFAQRQPAVLQRPMHSDGPAEPSAAFQTTHTSGSYGRRRGSSNVSGGSGSFLRQAIPPESQDARRGSLINDHPVSPIDHPAPVAQAAPRQSPYEARASPATPSATLQTIPDAQPQPNMEDIVELQKKLMQERRAEAIKRRQEQEAQEEAAKKERLAKKLAALGPPPERRGGKKEESSEAPKAEVEQATVPSAPQVLPQVAKDVRPASAIPNGEPTNAEPAPKPSSGAEQSAPTVENKHAHPWVQPQIPAQPEPAIWGSVQQSRNVWGAPNNDRTLGNGSFTIAAFDAQSSQKVAATGGRPAPGPIGPPRATPQARPSSSSSRQLGPIGPPRAPDQDEKAQKRNRWTQQVMAGDTAFYTAASNRSAELERNLKASGLDYVDIQPQIQEEFTEVDEDGNVMTRSAMTYGSAARWPTAASTAAPSEGNFSGVTVVASQQSRFFPSSSIQQPEPLAPDTGRPPGEHGLPAFDDDDPRPHVQLPRERPLVKLPPAIPAVAVASQRSHQSASSWGQQPQLRGGGSGSAQAVTATPATFTRGEKPLTAMDKINALLKDHKQPSSVNSSTRTAFTHPAAGPTTTVSLPFLYASPAVVHASSYTTKEMDEDCFEEQEMGSLPAVHIPTDVPEAAYNPAKAPPRQDRRLAQVVATTAEVLVLQPESRNTLIVQLPCGERKTVSMPVRSPNPNTRRGGRSNSRYASSTYRGSNRGQDSSAPYVPDQSSASGASSGSARGRGRGQGYRGRGDRADRGDWNRAAAPAVQTQ